MAGSERWVTRRRKEARTKRQRPMRKKSVIQYLEVRREKRNAIPSRERAIVASCPAATKILINNNNNNNNN